MMDKTTPNLDQQPIDQDDVSDTYILGRQVAHEFYSSAIQTYINAESAAAQVEVDAQKAQAEKQGKDKAQSKKQTEGKAAEKSFADMMVGTMQRRQGGTEGKGSGKVAPEGGGGGWGDENAPEGMPSAEKETQAELGGLEEPMVDPTTAGAAGAAGVAKAGMAAGLGIMRTLPRAIAAGVVSAGTDYPIGASADAVGAVSPALALPFALTVGLLSGVGIEPVIERGILRAAAAAGKKLSPDALREQVQLMKGILANEAGQVDVWRGSPHRKYYHGTYRYSDEDDFTELNKEFLGRSTGGRNADAGFWFTEDYNEAISYARPKSREDKTSSIYEAIIDENDMSHVDWRKAMENEIHKNRKYLGFDKNFDPKKLSHDELEQIMSPDGEGLWNWMTDEINAAKASGKKGVVFDNVADTSYKGLIVEPHRQVVVFDGKDVRLVQRKSGGKVEDLTKQAVIDEINKEVGGKGLREALDILKNERGAVNLYFGKVEPAAEQQLRQTVFKPKEADPVQNAFSEIIAKQADQFESDTLVDEMQALAKDKRYLQEEIEAYFGEGVPGHPGLVEGKFSKWAKNQANELSALILEQTEAYRAGLRKLKRTASQRGEITIKPGKIGPELRSEPGYVYHATNLERANEISEGKLRVYKAHEFTDQDAWPDGATEKRSYWSREAGSVWHFAPEYGEGVILRTKESSKFKTEIYTGDVYATKPISSKEIEILGEDGKWYSFNESSIKKAAQLLKGESGQWTIKDGKLAEDPDKSLVPVKGGSKKSGIHVPETESAAAGPVQPGMVRGAREMLANTNPDITKETAGNIRLWGADIEPKFMGDIETPEDIMRVISGTHEAFADQQEAARRGVRSWEETAAEAKKYRIEDILGRRMGQALNAEQVDNARTLLVSSADTLKSMAQVVRSGQANDLQKADFMRAFNVHYAIQMQLSGAAAEAGRALQIFRKVAQADDIKVGQIKDFLSASATSGVTPDKLAEAIATMESPAQVAAFVKQAKRATTWDMFIEAWINGLLSGPVTHAVNTTSNMLVSLWMIPERALAAGISKLHGGEIKGGEVTAQAFGLVHGFKDGLKLGWQALKTGESADVFNKLEARQMRSITSENVRELPLIKKLSPNALQEGGVAAQAVDLLGEVIRVPGRFLGAEDDFFKAVGYRMELNALAFRKGVAEGLEGNALTRMIQEIIADPQVQAPEVHLAAIEASRYQTFTNELGAGGKGLQTAANKIPGVKLIVPFIRTPTNILKFAAERTPLGLAMRKVRDDIAAGGARRDMALARISMGSMAMATVGAYAAAGHITGGGPSDSALRQHLLNQGWQPYSILIGNKYYSYGRLEPLGMMFGLAADAVEIMGEADETESDKIATAIVASIGKNVTSKTWLRGMSEVIHAMDDPDRYGQNYIKSLAGTVVPSAVAQIERTIDPEIADARTALDAIKARTPGFSKDLPTRRNLWGEKIQFNGALGPDIISPIFTSEKKDSPIDKELFRMKAPIRMPAKSQSFEGVQANLDAFEYEELLIRMNKIKLEATGKNLKKSLNDLVTKDPDYKALKSDDQKERMIRGYLQEAKEKALIEMLETNNELRMVVEDEHRRREALQ